jgi:nucleoside-diphosphate-sugar epimerase
MSKFLVTGGAGFIGSNIAERLLKEGHYVRILDNFSTGKRENIELLKKVGAHGPDVIEGDILDKNACARACEGMEYVLHQAALRSVPKSMKDPESYNSVNINGILYMLQAASRAGVKRFVFASSSSVYGDTDRFPEREGAYPLLISPYALSKLTGEYYCRIFSEHFALETVALRYFNVFGPRQALDDEYAVVIPKFIHCILHNQQPPIFGTGKQSRDFTYIDNVVQANILAATVNLGASPSAKNSRSARHEVLNVANGKDHTVLQLVEFLNKIIGKDIKPAFLPLRAGDVFKTLADIGRIKKVLGFKPQVDFLQGLKLTVEYFKNV